MTSKCSPYRFTVCIFVIDPKYKILIWPTSLYLMCQDLQTRSGP